MVGDVETNMLTIPLLPPYHMVLMLGLDANTSVRASACLHVENARLPTSIFLMLAIFDGLTS